MRRDPTGQTPAAQDDPRDLLDAVRAYVEYQRTTGIDGFPRTSRATEAAPAPHPPAAPPVPAATAAPAPITAPAVRATPEAPDPFASPEVQNASSLEALRAAIGDCQRCKLWPGRTHLVFGVGNPQADLVFVGEGPGRDEDLKGEPFVGRAGQLLTEIITKGMKLRREDVYIANVVKCRPPENRNPEPDEIAACRPFLERQLALIQPRVVVALGTFAAQTLLGVRTPISRLRGQWHEYQGVKLMPTLHPAYLLRNPNDKRLVWEDIKLVLRELGRLP